MPDDQQSNLPEQSPQETAPKRYAIREGAGLDESRLNTEVIDAIQKYGAWVLIAAAVALGAYSGLQYLERQRAEAHATAHTELSDALDAGSPDRLLSVATLHDEYGAVGIRARLRAADLYLESCRIGLVPGAQLTPESAPASDADVLSDEQKTEQLTKAERQYQDAYNKAKATEHYALHTVSALYGLAAVAESRGELDKARTFYTEIVERCDKADLPLPGAEAKQRLASLDTLPAEPLLYARADVLALAPPPTPEPVPVTVPEGGGGMGGVGGMVPNPDGTITLPDGGVLTPVDPSEVPEETRNQQPAPAPEQPQPAEQPAGE